MDLTRNGEYAEDSLDANWTESIYIVQANSNVTITGDLAVGRNTTIILCDNSTLKVTGSLNVAASGACIFGQTSTHQAKDAGKLIVQNTVDAGPAVRNAGGSELGIYGGSMELHGGTGKQITDNVGLYSEGSNGKIMKGTLDGKALKLNEWDGPSQVQTIAGSTLVLKYCEHDNEDFEYVHDEGANTHHRHCDACGLDYGSEACNFIVDANSRADENGHYGKCWCGNESSTSAPHNYDTLPTQNGAYHTSICRDCGYVNRSAGRQAHSWDAITGECLVCGLHPRAADDYEGLYETVDEALEAAAKEGYSVIHLYTYENGQTGIMDSVVFNAPGKSVTLDTAGYTLVGTGTTLTVEAGTLILTNNKKGDNSIHIEQPGRNETAAPAIEVTGGKLIVNGDLTAEGGFAGSDVRKPAIKATGGELELNGNLNLKGGLTLLEDAKLNTPLTRGVFWAADGESQTFRIDLRGNKASEPANHPDLESILETGYIFVQSDENGTPITDTDGNYDFYPPDGVSIGGNTTIVAHTHSYHSLTNSVAGRYHACDCGKSAEHTFENGVCSVCRYACPHSGASLNTETGNYECSACGMTMVVKSEKDGATTYYSILGTALAGAENGATVTLLTDLTTWEVSRGGGIYGKEITLDLNGHSITTRNGYNIGVQDEYLPATLKIVGEGNITPALIVVPGGKLDLSGWTGGTITNVSMSDRPVVGDNRAEPALIVGTGAGHIQDLTYSNWLIGKISQTTLSGGSYGKIVWMNHEYSEQPAFPTSAMLASGYAFKNSDGSYVLYTKTLERNEAFANVSVVQCPHGALTTDASGALRCGYCNADMSGFAVEITDKDGNTGYSSDPADGFYRAYIVKVKLLKDCNDYGEVNHAMTIDLNGKTIRGLTIAAAGVQIIDSAETKGSIGTLTVTADGVTLRDLLADGYGFRSTDGTWVAEGAATASNVTIAKVPIKDVYFFEGEDKEENKITSLTKTYGETRTLYAGIDWGEGRKTATQTMYLVKDDGSLETVGGSFAYDLPAFGQYAGTYTYRFTVTAEGYSKSAEITVTVNKADFAAANISFSLDNGGKIMFYPNASTGEGVERTMRVTGGSFQDRKPLTEGEDYTVSGNTGVNVGDYTLTITAAADSKKFTGTKTVSWKITPFTLGAPNFTGGPLEKNYDGTTTPPTGCFAGSFDPTGSSSITLTEGTHFTCTANLVDANVGDSKAINFSVTLKSPNYVFSSRLNAVENCTVSADGKTLTYSNYSNFGSSLNVKPIDLPVALPALSTDITNGAVQTYTMPLSLPALPAPMQYGTVTYGTPAFTAEPLSSGESYDITATVDENGVLSLEVRGTSGS